MDDAWAASVRRPLTRDLRVVRTLDLHPSLGVEDVVVLEDVLPRPTVFEHFRRVAPSVGVQAVCVPIDAGGCLGGTAVDSSSVALVNTTCTYIFV